MTQHIHITRVPQHNQTLGVFYLDEVKFCTLEPAWRDNQQNISCIPDGTYLLTHHNSPTYGKCLKLHSVDGRTDILMHYGNFNTNTQGCILVGDGFKDINKDGTVDITNSRATCLLLFSMLSPYTQHKVTLTTPQH